MTNLIFWGKAPSTGFFTASLPRPGHDRPAPSVHNAVLVMWSRFGPHTDATNFSQKGKRIDVFQNQFSARLRMNAGTSRSSASIVPFTASLADSRLGRSRTGYGVRAPAATAWPWPLPLVRAANEEDCG
jgi:hypothetical protein